MTQKKMMEENLLNVSKFKERKQLVSILAHPSSEANVDKAFVAYREGREQAWFVGLGIVIEDHFLFHL